MVETPRTVYYRKKLPPCKGCNTRSADCHPNCDKYKEWQAAHDTEKAKAYEKYLSERRVTEYQVDMYRKYKKRWHK